MPFWDALFFTSRAREIALAGGGELRDASSLSSKSRNCTRGRGGQTDRQTERERE